MRKTILVIAYLLSVGTTAFSQDNNMGMRDEFRTISNFGRRQSGFEAIQTYSNRQVSGRQFFTETWSKGAITSIINQTIGNGYVFLYDKLKQELYFKPNDSDLVMLADKSQIQSFIIDSDKPHFFVPASKYDPALKENFMEILISHDKYSLMKITRTTFEKANMNDMVKIKEGDFTDKFVDHITYYIYNNGQLQKIPSLKEGSIRRALKSETKALDIFFERYENTELTEDLLMTLVNSLN